MKPNKKSQTTQRKVLDRKLRPWLPLRDDRVPPSGWLKAIRSSLGMSTRQLAARLGVQHAAILQFEKGEVEGKITLNTLKKVARAMRCQVVYAIVPEAGCDSLDAILDDQARQAARAIIARVDHSMRLEQQGISPEQTREQIRDFAAQLKSEMAPSLWSDPQSILASRGKKRK